MILLAKEDVVIGDKREIIPEILEMYEQVTDCFHHALRHQERDYP
jgi:hypothetical protein